MATGEGRDGGTRQVFPGTRRRGETLFKRGGRRNGYRKEFFFGRVRKGREGMDIKGGGIDGCKGRSG